MALDLPFLDAAINLRALNPLGWELFLQQLDRHAMRLAADLVRADASRLHVGQGQAQSIRQLHEALSNASTLKDALTKKATT